MLQTKVAAYNEHTGILGDKYFSSLKVCPYT